VTRPAGAACRCCGAPLAPRQEYCLECGGRVLAARRGPGPTAWLLPSALSLLVAAGGAAAAIAAARSETRRPATPAVALSRLERAPARRAARPSAPAHGRAAARRLIPWPGHGAYTIVLASYPLDRDAAAAKRAARRALARGLPQVGILVSTSYPTLQPGYVVVFSGVYPSLEDAQSALPAARRFFPAAFARPVAR